MKKKCHQQLQLQHPARQLLHTPHRDRPSPSMGSFLTSRGASPARPAPQPARSGICWLTGSTKWLRLYEWDSGTFPNLRVNTLFAPCYHCANPACVPAANGAMYKEPKYGAVLIDPAQATSANLRAAWEACPYGAIVFDSDLPSAKASKCTMCIDRLEQSLQPVCVMSCMMESLLTLDSSAH